LLYRRESSVVFPVPRNPLCTRMKRKPKGVNYGIALPRKGAEIAKRRIPKQFAIRNRLNIFSVSDNGKVWRYKPCEIG